VDDEENGTRMRSSVDLEQSGSGKDTFQSGMRRFIFKDEDDPVAPVAVVTLLDEPFLS
jgi:hypothetical protein